MFDRELRAVATIDRLGMDAAPGVAFIQTVTLHLADLNAPAEINAVNDDPKRRGFDHRSVSERDAVSQPRLFARQKLKANFSVGAGDDDIVRLKWRRKLRG